MGTDRVLIGAFAETTGASRAGAAYLFSISGTLLTTFTNPAPTVDAFLGWSLAAVGTDRVLIGASGESTGAHRAGVAHLFGTNGTLLTTFTNPSPADLDYFGSSVAAIGNDRVLIGTPNDDTGAPYAGAAYLFSTDGTLLTTITNPAPAEGDWFGTAVAAVGTDRVLIGASQGDTFTDGSGLAYLLSIEPRTPELSVTQASGNVMVSWPRAADGFVLDETLALASSPATTEWSPVPTATYQTNASSLFISMPAPTGNKFYRLRKP
jgi:hypothetical protein